MGRQKKARIDIGSGRVPSVAGCTALSCYYVRLVSAAVRPFHAQCTWIKIFPFH